MKSTRFPSGDHATAKPFEPSAILWRTPLVTLSATTSPWSVTKARRLSSADHDGTLSLANPGSRMVRRAPVAGVNTYFSSEG